MAGYAAESVYTVHETAELAADGLEALLEATETTLIIRYAAVIKINLTSYMAVLTTSDATT